MLHTRSTKYGLLSQGQVVRVPAELVRRQRHHFQTIENAGVDIILGCNGLVWITSRTDGSAAQQAPGGGFNEQQHQDGGSVEKPEPSVAQRQSVARVAQSVLALSRLGLALQGGAIARIVQLSVERSIEPKFMLEADFLSAVAADEEAQRQGEAAMEM